MTLFVSNSTMELISECPPGQVAVVREYTSEYWDRAGKIVKIDETKDYERKVNPWSLVVGVGDDVVTRHGNIIRRPCERGHVVAVSMAGLSLPLTSGDGEVMWIYVVPFEAVLQVQAWRCKTCNWTTRFRTGLCDRCAGIVSSADAQVEAVS